LVLGALIGLAVGDLSHRVLPWAIDYPEAFAVVGMAAYFTAIVRAPITGIVLIVEMTNTYAQMLALLVACFSAYAVAELFDELPIYEALLERDLARDGRPAELYQPQVIELMVQEGSRFDGTPVHALGLPAGCVLITLRRGLGEIVPTADTHLEAGDRITAVIAPQATNALLVLREGCETARTRRPDTLS
jgi:CIC family chloride channel protein